MIWLFHIFIRYITTLFLVMAYSAGVVCNMDKSSLNDLFILGLFYLFVINYQLTAKNLYCVLCLPCKSRSLMMLFFVVLCFCLVWIINIFSF